MFPFPADYITGRWPFKPARCCPRGSYQQLVLVNVFRVSGRVLDLFAEHQRDLKQEEVPVPPLADQRFGVPDLEGVLEDELALNVQVLVKP